MFRFTLGQMFQGVTLSGIALSFMLCDGCGQHFETISSIAFSPNGTRLAVARHDARDANTPMKAYLCDVSRTISVFDGTSLRFQMTVEQRLLSGNQGPAFGEFRYAGPSLAFTDDETLAVGGFTRGEPLAKYSVDSKRITATAAPSEPAHAICLNRLRTTLATGHDEWGHIWDARTNQLLMQVQASHMPFRNAPCIALSRDASMMATAGYDGLSLWTVPDGALKLTSAPQPNSSHVVALEFACSEDRLLVASGDSVQFMDFEGNILQQTTIGEQVRDVKLSPDGNNIAVATTEGVSIFDSATFEHVRRLTKSAYTRCIEYSPNGKLLAGGAPGCVVLWDSQTGECVGKVKPPGRVRPPWTLPLAVLIAWLVLSGWFARRKKLSVA